MYRCLEDAVCHLLYETKILILILCRYASAIAVITALLLEATLALNSRTIRPLKSCRLATPQGDTTSKFNCQSILLKLSEITYILAILNIDSLAVSETRLDEVSAIRS